MMSEMMIGLDRAEMSVGGSVGMCLEIEVAEEGLGE